MQCSDGYRKNISHLSWREDITLMRERGLGFKEMLQWSNFCFQRYLDPDLRALDGFHRYFDIYFDVAHKSANVVSESILLFLF